MNTEVELALKKARELFVKKDKKEYVRYPNHLPFATTSIPVDEPNGFWDMYVYDDGQLFCAETGIGLGQCLMIDGIEVAASNVVFAMHNTFTGLDVTEQPSLASLVVGHLDGDPDNICPENLYLEDIRWR